MNPYLPYIIGFSFLISFLISRISIPLAFSLGKNLNIIDLPNERKLNNKKIIRSGGISIAIGFFIAIFIIFFINILFTFLKFDYFKILPILLGSICLFSIGLLDDIFSLPPKRRLIGQFIISILIWFLGIRIDIIDLSFINNNFSPIVLPNTLSLIFTTIWLAGVTNAINWIDGIDGLSAGIISLNSIGIIIFALSFQNFYIAILCAVMAGSTFAFLKYNSYPAKIIMGDSGSYFLGFTIASLSLLGLRSFEGVLNLHLAFIILLIPIVDMTTVILNRIIKGLSPFYPDKTHIHHKLLKMGFNQKETVKLIFNVNLLAITLGLITLDIYYLNFLLFVIITLGVFNILNIIKKLKRI